MSYCESRVGDVGSTAWGTKELVRNHYAVDPLSFLLVSPAVFREVFDRAGVREVSERSPV